MHVMNVCHIHSHSLSHNYLSYFSSSLSEKTPHVTDFSYTYISGELKKNATMIFACEIPIAKCLKRFAVRMPGVLAQTVHFTWNRPKPVLLCALCIVAQEELKVG